MAKEEYIFQLSMLEQEMNSLAEKVQIIDQHILELQGLYFSLQELDKSKEKEILANLGKNIFIKTEIKEKKLLVDVGSKIFVKKEIPETLKIVEEQVSQLENAKNQVMRKLQELKIQVDNIIEQAEKSEGK